MKILASLIFAVIMTALIACGNKPLQETGGTAPVDDDRLSPVYPIEPDQRNIAYGQDPQQVFDFWKGKDSLSPAVIYFHGGAFVRGTRASIKHNIMKRAVEKGYAAFSIEYRLLSDKEPVVRFPAPFIDSRVAVAYIYNNSERFGIDTERIVLAGSSAGSSLAIWNALIDSASFAEFTGIMLPALPIKGVIGYNAFIQYEPVEFYKYFGENITIPTPFYLGFEGDNPMALEGRDREVLDFISPLKYVSASDPPVLLLFNDSMDIRQKEDGTIDWIHHPFHGIALKEKYDAFGLPIEMFYAEAPSEKNKDLQFLQSIFNR